MQLEGKIEGVMESWPLQLAATKGSERYHVQLLLETTITKKGVEVVASVLQPGVRIRIEGTSTKVRAMTAQKIEVLD